MCGYSSFKLVEDVSVAVFGVEKDVGRGGDIEELPPVVAARNSADVSIYVDDDSMGRYRGLCLDVLGVSSFSVQ